MGGVDEWDQLEVERAVVIKRVDATAVYINKDGNVVIRQQDVMGNDDGFVVIPKHLVPALVAALNRVAGDA